MRTSGTGPRPGEAMPSPDEENLSPGPRPDVARTARVFYTAYLLAPILAMAVVVALGPTGQAPVADPGFLRWGAILAALLAVAAALALRTRLDPPHADRQRWWRANFVRAALIWALLELGGILQAVAYILTGDALLFLSVTLLFLFPMALLTPAQLSGE